MTKLGKAAAIAMAVTCLAGNFFITDSFKPVTTQQQVYESTAAYADNVQKLNVMKKATAEDLVNLTGNREVAGLAAVMSGTLDIKSEDAQNKANTEAKKNADNQKTEAAKKETVILTAKVENSLNIRKKPSDKAELTAKLFRGCTAEVIGEKGDWYQVKSGKVKGWVSKDYVLTGAKADKFLKKVKPSVAEVTGKTLNLRKKPSTDSDVVSVLKEGARFMVLNEGKEWVKVRYTSNLEGYVSAEYVDIKDGAGKAVSMEKLEIYEKRAAKKEAERQAKAAAEAAAAAAAAEAEQEAQRNADVQSKTTSSRTSSAGERSVSRRSSYSASVDDTTLLAALCQYEAGTNYENCLAVANVVLNRVRSSSYPNSIRGVIYQSGQFGTVTSGALNRFISNGPSSTCVRAAKAALSGSNNIGSRVSFRAVWATNPSSHKNSVVIGDNCFF
ncbi:MAG: cell wall hydrolase [Lachnospiraceae bacterium]|nr:cell wall hydrolase [Lachnospiraceae bacterium]